MTSKAQRKELATMKAIRLDHARARMVIARMRYMKFLEDIGLRVGTVLERDDVSDQSIWWIPSVHKEQFRLLRRRMQETRKAVQVIENE